MSAEKPDFKIEASKEFKYTYRDNNAGAEVVFECQAKNITEADKLYQAATGMDPRKQNYVGCSIEKIDLEDQK